MKLLEKKYIIIYVVIIINYGLLFSSDWRASMDSYNRAIQSNDLNKALNFAYETVNLSIAEFGKNSEYYAASLGKLGEVYFLLHNYDSSLKYYLDQRDVLKAIAKDTSDNYAFSCNNISVIYQMQGKFNQAEVYLKESLQIKKLTKGEMDTSYAKSMHNLGNIYKELVDYDQAEKTYLYALELKRKLFGANNTSYAITAFNLAGIYKELGNYEKAKTLYEECKNIYKSQLGENSKEYKQTILSLADIYIKVGELNLAEKMLDQNIGNDNKASEEQADMLFTKALLKYKSNQYNEAESLLLRAKSIIEKTLGKGSPLYSSCLNNLGVIAWRLNKKEQAYSYLMEAIILREKILGRSNPDFATSVHNLAGLLKDLSKPDEADQYYKEAFDLYLQQIKIFFPFLSDTEKEKFYGKLRNRIGLFNSYAIERMNQKPEIVGDIYNYQIATKALLLNNSINVRKNILQSGNPELIELFNKWKSIREQLSKLYKLKKSELAAKSMDIDSIENVANNLEKDLSRNPYFKKEYAKERVHWQDIQKNLNEDEAAVEIIRFRFKYNVDLESDTILYLALILTKETVSKPEIVIFYDGYEMENLYINGYQNSITLELEDKDSYSLFWEKIDKKLSGKKIIYVSQDGVYNKINLNTLQLPDGSFLIDKKDIIIVSNTADIIEQKNKKLEFKNKKAALIGYPKFFIEPLNDKDTKSYIKIPELPGTKIEIDNIKGILERNNWQTEEIIEDKATKPTLSSLKNYSLIHIATHGYFEQDLDLTKYDNLFGIDVAIAAKNPLLRSGLVFAGAENTIKNIPLDKDTYDNGFLNANDVMNLDLINTDLVVLSACQTGTGEVRNGDGVYGLQRAFLVAGAKSLIMSLWKVNDKTTQELMVLFYKYFMIDNNVMSAFKKAQLKLREIYPHPYFWGAFIVIGDTK